MTFILSHPELAEREPIDPERWFTVPSSYKRAAEELRDGFRLTREIQQENRKAALIRLNNKGKRPTLWRPDLSDPYHFDVTYEAMGSVRQSGVAKDGYGFEALAKHCYAKVLFPSYLIGTHSQVKLGSGKERDIDLAFRFDGRLVFVNCKATTRERSNIWVSDLSALHLAYGDTDWLLVGLFAEKNYCGPLQESIDEVQRLYRFVSARVAPEVFRHFRCVCAQDIDGHVDFLRQASP